MGSHKVGLIEKGEEMMKYHATVFYKSGDKVKQRSHKADTRAEAELFIRAFQAGYLIGKGTNRAWLPSQVETTSDESPIGYLPSQDFDNAVWRKT